MSTTQQTACILVLSILMLSIPSHSLVVEDIPFSNPKMTAKIDQFVAQIEPSKYLIRDQFAEKLVELNDEQETCKSLKAFVNVIPAVNQERPLLEKIKNPIEKVKTNFRLLAYKLLISEQKHNTHMTFNKGLRALEMLKMLKARYFNQFMKNQVHEDYTKDHINILNKQYAELLEKYDEMDNKVSSKEEDLIRLRSDLEGVEETLQNEEGFKEKLLILRLAQQTLEELEIIDSIDNFYMLNDTELVLIDPQNEEILKSLKELFDYFEKLTMIIETFNSIHSIIVEEKETREDLQNNVSQKYDSISSKSSQLVLSLNSVLANKKEEFKPQLTVLKKNVQVKKDALYKEVTGNRDYKTYKDLIIKIKSLTQTLAPLEKDFFKLQKQKYEFEFKLGKIRANKMMEMVIPKNEIFELTQKISDQARQLDYIHTLQLKDIQDSKSESEKKLIEANNLLIQSKKMLIEKLKENESKLDQMNHINALESHVDMALGYLFGKVYIMKNNTKCFLLSQLSYYFFNLILNNFIIDESVFLKQFLLQIPETEAKLFVTSNYKIFASEDFYKSKLIEYKKTRVSSFNSLGFRQIIEEYTINFGLVVNMYKDFKKSIAKSALFTLATKSYAFAGIYFSLRSIFDFLKDLGTDTGITYLMTILAEVIISVIPFLGCVQFLKILTIKILTRIYKVVYSLLSKVLKLTSEEIVQVFNFLKQRMVDRNLGKYVFDLNSIKETKRGFTLVSSKSSASTEFAKLGEKYADIYNLETMNEDPDNVNLFNEQDYFLDISVLLEREDYIKYKKLEFYGLLEKDPEFDASFEEEEITDLALLSSPKFVYRRII